MTTLRLVTATSTANPNEHDLYLDDSGQLVWIGGDVTDGEDYAMEIAQSILCRLRLIRGEWYLDQRLGLPWRERIWRKGASSATIKAIFTEAIADTPGVREVRSVAVDLDHSDRTATIEFAAVTETGHIVTSSMLDTPFVIEVIA